MERLSATSNIRELHRDGASSHVACSRCSISEICLPRMLSLDEVQCFEQIVNRSRPIQDGEFLFRSGDPFRTIVSVRTGCFKSYVIDHEGREHVLAFHLPGEIIGLDAIHDFRHAANVVALGTSAACAINFDSITRMARQMPELQAELFHIMSGRIHDLEAIDGELSADERIAMFLLSLSERFARRHCSEQEFSLAMSRRDVASYLLLAAETVSRVLTRFQKAGLVRIERKQVCILDRDELRKVARHEAARPTTGSRRRATASRVRIAS